MPCHYYTPGEEAEIRATKARKKLDELTAEADKLREILIDAVENNKVPEPDEKLMKEIVKRQIDHRKMDLARLEDTFTRNKDADRLKKVWAANPKLPLEPQLGFDPDDF